MPHHGDSMYTDIEFFKRVRARYYVFSGVEPCREVFEALLEAKKLWEDKDLGKYRRFRQTIQDPENVVATHSTESLYFSEVTIIPTYDTDALGYWVAEKEEELAENKIDLAPSASR